MRQNVLDALSGKFPRSIPSKESLNHPGIIRHVGGFDVFDDTPHAFDIAWRRLGIDIHVPLPGKNAVRPKVSGGTWDQGNMRYADIGVYPTSMQIEYCPDMDKSDDDWVFKYDTSGDDFDLNEKITELRAIDTSFRSHFGDQAVMYQLYYTTLFMWPVVTFSWEPFMMAAATQPERFDEQLWEPWSHISRKHCEALVAMNEEVIFCHDDLVMTTGSVFPPDFYERFIFPRYEYIFEPIVKAGKKLVFVCDGNMDVFLERLLEFPIAAIMFESPATAYERVLETWGKAGRGFIGGIATGILTSGTPEEVRNHTRDVIE
ncbi:MAG: uroporphyrinogen decarboxylase family protein, partial [Candidatus Latescibacteria bacterium]|nr:uroporphyrinogen decarboxylase family protein [Candidatus Latescibacterota bacterium]